MANIYEIEDNINYINRLKEKLQSTIDEMSLADPVDKCEEYSQLLKRYEEEKKSLQDTYNELASSYRVFYDSYYGKNGKLPSKDLMGERYIQIMLNTVSPLLNNMMEQFSPTIDSEDSRIKSTNYNKLRNYIIETIGQNPGYVIGRKKYFRFDDFKLYKACETRRKESGFDSIRINATSVEYGVDSRLIPAFFLQLFKKGIIEEPFIPRRDMDYLSNKHRIDDENHYYPLDRAFHHEIKQVSDMESKVNGILSSKDKRCDAFGTIAIETNMGSIAIETTPRVLAKYGLYFDDLNFKPYGYVITVNDLAKALLPKKILEAFFAKQDIPPRDIEGEKQGFFVDLQ